VDRKVDFAEILRDAEEQFGLPQEVLAVKLLMEAHESAKSPQVPKRGTIWAETIYPFIKPMIQDFAKKLDSDDNKEVSADELTSKVGRN